MPEQEYLIVEHLSLKDIVRIFSKIKVNPVTGCWEWQGSRTGKHGHGQVSYQGRMELTHRVMYAWLVAPLPRGAGRGLGVPELDHIVCSNRICCFPAHVKLVPHRDNALRSEISPTAINAAKTHCLKGHLLPTNEGRPGRRCTVCMAERRNTPENKAKHANYIKAQRVGPRKDEIAQRHREACARYYYRTRE